MTKLKSYESKLPKEKQKSYNQKVANYEIKLKEQNKCISSAATSAADKDRNFNIIIIEKNPKYSLSIEFLFFLKEKGKKVNHFNKEVIDLILFEDLNIKVVKNEEYNDKKGYNIEQEQEQENDNRNEKLLYKGKTEFNGSEIIEMLKSPLKYHKEEININNICSYIYDEINDIKKITGYSENEKKFNDLKDEAIKLNNKINDLISIYKQNDSTNKYKHIIELKDKINNKIKLYETIEQKLALLDKKKLEIIENMDNLINKVKNESKRKVKLLSLSDIFNEFKNELKDKIKEEEYKYFDKIFNENNINEFKIDDIYSFLEENLNYSNALFSITKNDITNFNFLINVITEYDELASYVYNKDLDIKILSK